MAKRVCLIGLDGVGPGNLKTMLESIPLNALSSIAGKGFASPAPSIPPYTPPAWTSIFTGVNPGKHGIFGFYVVEQGEEGFSIRVASSRDVMYPRVFEIAAMKGLRSVVINVPLTYPVSQLLAARNLVLVSDWSPPAVHPP